jgi:GTP-binding protein Era
MTKSGFVAVIGRPNTGKSTLINYLTGSKVSIVSHRPQTTRFAVRGIVTTDEAQVIFTDTPGFHKPKDSLGTHLNEEVTGAARDADVLLFLVDAGAGIGQGDEYLISEFENLKKPKLLVVTKSDLLTEKELAGEIEKTRALGEFDETVAISAAEGRNCTLLLDKIIKHLPEGPFYFPEDELTDLPDHKLLAEVIREKVFELIHQEVPYSVAVVIESIEKRDDRDLVDVTATIYVERDSQKGILIGEKGKTLKNIGSRARAEMEELFEKQVFLDIRVKVEKNWRKNDRFVRELLA